MSKSTKRRCNPWKKAFKNVGLVKVVLAVDSFLTHTPDASGLKRKHKQSKVDQDKG